MPVKIPLIEIPAAVCPVCGAKVKLHGAIRQFSELPGPSKLVFVMQVHCPKHQPCDWRVRSMPIERYLANIELPSFPRYLQAKAVEALKSSDSGKWI